MRKPSDKKNNRSSDRRQGLEPTPPTAVRLQKYLADRGLCSRRQADRMIADAEVMVNGKTAVLGQKVIPGVDQVTIPGQHVPEQLLPRVTVALNKPRGFLSSNHDPHHDRTVFDLLPPSFQRLRLFCAGRLDKESEGLLILTNDGELAHKITHPSSGIIKRYQVELHKPLKAEIIPRLLKGMEVEGEWLQASKVIPAERGPDAGRRVEVHLQQGKKREIRRLFEAHGYFVERLKRFQIGNFTLRGLAPGAAKELNSKEIHLLLDQQGQ